SCPRSWINTSAPVQIPGRQRLLDSTADQIMAMLSNNGLRCKARREPGREYCITCPQGLLEYARLQFLPSGELAVIANGFRMTDKPHSLSKFASAILRRFPRGE